MSVSSFHWNIIRGLSAFARLWFSLLIGVFVNRTLTLVVGEYRSIYACRLHIFLRFDISPLHLQDKRALMTGEAAGR